MMRTCSKGILVFGILFSLLACGNNNSPIRLPDDPTQEQPPIPAAEPAEPPETNVPDSGEFTPPDTTPNEREAILAKYDYLDPDRIVPSKALADTVLYFDKNQSKLNNKNYISVIDFGKSSKEKRFFIINMKTGSVQAIHVAHGKGSDANHDGFAEKFSNASGSNASSLGFYTTAETYNGSNGYSLRLDGRSSTNSNARSRAIVIHGADYVQESRVIQGRSWGCPAVTTSLRTKVINMLKGGSLIYALK